MSSEQALSGEEFHAAWQRIGIAVTLLAEDEALDPLSQMIVRAETLGPILEPTAYMRGGADNLQDQAEILGAVVQLRAVHRRVKARALKRAGALA